MTGPVSASDTPNNTPSHSGLDLLLETKMIIREKQLKMRVRTKQKYGRLIDANISYKNPSDRLTDNTVSQHIQYFLTLSIFSFMENSYHSTLSSVFCTSTKLQNQNTNFKKLWKNSQLGNLNFSKLTISKILSFIFIFICQKNIIRHQV